MTVPVPSPRAVLTALAYERDDAAAYRIWSRLDPEVRRVAMTDPNVLRSVITHAASLLPETEPDGILQSMPALLATVASDLRAADLAMPFEWNRTALQTHRISRRLAQTRRQ